MSSRSDQAAALLAELVERGKTSGRPGSDHELADLLEAALDPYGLARLVAVAQTHLGRLHGARARQEAIEAGSLTPNERPPADLGNGRPLGRDPSTGTGALPPRLLQRLANAGSHRHPPPGGRYVYRFRMADGSACHSMKNGIPGWHEDIDSARRCAGLVS